MLRALAPLPRPEERKSNAPCGAFASMNATQGTERDRETERLRGRVMNSLLPGDHVDNDEFSEAEVEVIRQRLAQRNDAIAVDPETMEPVRPFNAVTCAAIADAMAGKTSRTTADDL